MELEAKNKDQADPTTQKVIDALTKAGFTITQQQQHLGSQQGATYCNEIDVAEHLNLVVCEYASAAAAVTGAEASRKNFAAIANRTIHVLRSTTLTVLELPADQTAVDAHKKALAAFEAL